MNYRNYNERETVVVSIDGGPCSGKSSVLDALQAESFDVPTVFIPELATVFGEELLERGTDYPTLAAEDHEEYLDYQHRIIGGYMSRITAAREQLADTGGLVITDRAPAGVRSYVTEPEWLQLTADLGTDPESIKHDYADAVVFLGSLAIANPEKFEEQRRSNPLRTETREQAVELHYRSLANWDGHGSLLEIDGDDVGYKRDKAKGFIAGLLQSDLQFA